MLNLDGISLAFSTTVRALGVIFDQIISFDAHITQVPRTALFHLCNCKKVVGPEWQDRMQCLSHAASVYFTEVHVATNYMRKS